MTISTKTSTAFPVRVVEHPTGFVAGFYYNGELITGTARTRFAAASAALSKLVSQLAHQHHGASPLDVLPSVVLVDAQTLASATECLDHSNMRVARRLARAGIQFKIGSLDGAPASFELTGIPVM